MSPSIEKPYARLGAKLRSLRKKKHLNLPDMAKASGVGERTLSDLEAGLRIPGGKNLTRLAEFFKTSPASLLR